MQYKASEYDAKRHDIFKALTVKLPYAEYLASGKKKIEIRSKNTPYRGKLLVCSSRTPEIEGMQAGATLAFVDLYQVKPISELTEEEWKLTMIPKEQYQKLAKGFAWFMQNERRVIEFPILGQLGIYNLVYTKDTIIEYPTVYRMP